MAGEGAEEGASEERGGAVDSDGAKEIAASAGTLRALGASGSSGATVSGEVGSSAFGAAGVAVRGAGKGGGGAAYGHRTPSVKVGSPVVRGRASGLSGTGKGKGFGRVHGMGRVDTGGGVGFSGEGKALGGRGAGRGVAARGSSGRSARSASATSDGKVEPHPRAPGREPEGKRAAPDRLTAGEWRDLDHWAFWEELFAAPEQGENRWGALLKPWGVAPKGRVPVLVRHEGRAVVDAEVTLRDGGRPVWTARTDSKGRAELFVDGAKGALSVVVRSGEASATVKEIKPGAKGPVRVVLGDAKAAANRVDVMFMVDTTGSMGDELNFLKAELGAVLERVQETNGEQLELRTSVNFYRDEGDEYVVRPHKFTKNAKQSIRQIRRQAAGGGGDFPEAVERALTNGVEEHAWSESARGRVMFLVLDAPPHQGPKVARQVQRSVREAARKGIRVVPVVGSGIDKDTEFLMRAVSIRTGGTYVFLTDHSGIGGSHIKPTIGPHKVELLSAVVERLINEAATGR